MLSYGTQFKEQIVKKLKPSYRKPTIQKVRMNFYKINLRLKGLLIKTLAHFGLALTKSETKRGPDLSEVFDNPIQSACFVGTVRPFLTVLPLSKGRTSRGISLDQDPRVKILRGLKNINDLDAFVLAFKQR